MPVDNEETFEHFCVHGWMRVRAAFSVDEAAAMREAAWHSLAKVGIKRSDPSTWNTAWFIGTSKTIRHRRAHAAPIIGSSFKVIPIFVAYTPMAISTNARPVSSTALKSMAALHCKSSRIQARRAT